MTWRSVADEPESPLAMALAPIRYRDELDLMKIMRLSAEMDRVADETVLELTRQRDEAAALHRGQAAARARVRGSGIMADPACRTGIHSGGGTGAHSGRPGPQAA